MIPGGESSKNKISAIFIAETLILLRYAGFTPALTTFSSSRPSSWLSSLSPCFPPCPFSLEKVVWKSWAYFYISSRSYRMCRISGTRFCGYILCMSTKIYTHRYFLCASHTCVHVSAIMFLGEFP